MNRWTPTKLTNGVVMQGGMNAQARGARRSIIDPSLRPFRAVVVASRVVGEAGNFRNLSVECDVILVRTNIAIQGVTVAQRQHGVNNVHDLWIPRPSTRIVDDDNAELNLNRRIQPDGTENPIPATPLGNTDGDQVLLDFIEGNIDWPIIVSALPHERTNRVVRAGAGWSEGSVEERGNPKRDEYYTHHYGTEVRINEAGDLLIDTVNAYDDPATEDNGADSGQVRVRVKDSQKLTIAMGDDEDVLEVWKDGDQVKIDLGEAAAQRLILGDDFRDFLNDWLSNVFEGHQHLAGMNLVAPSGGGTVTGQTGSVSPTALPGAIPPVTYLGNQMSTDLLSDLARTKKS